MLLFIEFVLTNNRVTEWLYIHCILFYPLCLTSHYQAKVRKLFDMNGLQDSGQNYSIPMWTVLTLQPGDGWQFALPISSPCPSSSLRHDLASTLKRWQSPSLHPLKLAWLWIGMWGGLGGHDKGGTRLLLRPWIIVQVSDDGAWSSLLKGGSPHWWHTKPCNWWHHTIIPKTGSS